jgi:hypothetical protein
MYAFTVRILGMRAGKPIRRVCPPQQIGLRACTPIRFGVQARLACVYQGPNIEDRIFYFNENWLLPSL